MYRIDITKEQWKEILDVLKEHKIPYTTSYEGEDKHIQINLVIPKFFND